MSPKTYAEITQEGKTPDPAMVQTSKEGNWMVAGLEREKLGASVTF